MEMNIRMGINCKLQFTPTVYNSLQSFADFKVDFHRIYIRVHKDPTKKWNELPYMAMDDVIFDVLEALPSEWHTPSIFVMEERKSATQRKREEAKLWVA